MQCRDHSHEQRFASRECAPARSSYTARLVLQVMGSMFLGVGMSWVELVRGECARPFAAAAVSCHRQRDLLQCCFAARELRNCRISDTQVDGAAQKSKRHCPDAAACYNFVTRLVASGIRSHLLPVPAAELALRHLAPLRGTCEVGFANMFKEVRKAVRGAAARQSSESQSFYRGMSISHL